MKEETSYDLERVTLPVMQELPGLTVLKDELHQCRFARPRLAMNPEESRTLLKPFPKSWEVKNPVEGILKGIVDVFNTKVQLC